MSIGSSPIGSMPIGSGAVDDDSSGTVTPTVRAISYCSVPRTGPVYESDLFIGTVYAGTPVNQPYYTATPLIAAKLIATAQVHHCG
jgi:hypothetical protein